MSRRDVYNITGGAYEQGRYSDSHMDAYKALRNRTLSALLNQHFGDQSLRILEVGCGTGLTLEYLARQQARHAVAGMDFSETMLAQAADKARRLENSFQLTQGDATQLPFRNAGMDVLIATRFIHQFPHDIKRRIWIEFQRVVRQDGLIVVEFYARPYHWLRYWFGGAKGRSRDDYFNHYPSQAEVREVVGASFEIRPLRLAGSRVMASVLPGAAMESLTESAGRVLGGLLLDEYFVAARR